MPGNSLRGNLPICDAVFRLGLYRGGHPHVPVIRMRRVAFEILFWDRRIRPPSLRLSLLGTISHPFDAGIPKL